MKQRKKLRLRKVVKWDDIGTPSWIFMAAIFIIMLGILLITETSKIEIIFSTIIIILATRGFEKTRPRGRRVYWEEI